MELIQFQLRGRFAHFLMAEANKDLPSYPLPPRTVILGLLGAMLGLAKDEPQKALEPAYIALQAVLPKSMWIKAKFHQSLPSPLDYQIKGTQSGNSANMSNPKILNQEWLINPEYRIWVHLPREYQNQLKDQLERQELHFSPYLGISEHLAVIDYAGCVNAELLPDDYYLISTVAAKDEVTLDKERILHENKAVHFLKMPFMVSADRVFQHRKYYFEQRNHGFWARSAKAYRCENNVIMFM